ncbi:MAG: sulfite exporter TauE/SafE family protein [Armatimonadaceae bacterium]
MDILWWVALAGMGFGVGIIAGMFGVGGGFLLTPLLIILFRVPELLAVGTGLCQMIGVSVSAQIRYARMGVGETKLGVMMTVPALLGVGLGKDIAVSLEEMGQITVLGREIAASRFWIAVCFLLLLSGIALYMALDLRRGSPRTIPLPGPLTRISLPPYTELPRTGRRISIPVAAYIGLGLGVLSGLLGVGGGVILTPLLIYGVGMSVAMSAGTGVTMLLATSLWGTFSYAQSERVSLPIALVLLTGSTFGAQIGALIATRFDGTKLRGIFVLLVALTAAAVLVDLIKALTG